MNHSGRGYASQVLDLLAYLDITSCVFVCFSFGPLVAAAIVERRPAIIARLVFLAPFHSSDARCYFFIALSTQIYLLGHECFGSSHNI
jgi:pimeloyl-ACP methyl ester carboxylesterase